MRSASLRGLGWPVLLYVASAAFAIWHLRLLEKPSTDVAELAFVAALAAAPALAAALSAAAPARRYALAAVPTAVIALSTVTGHWPFRPHLLGDDGWFRLVWDDLVTGGDLWTRTLLPFDPARYPQLESVVTLATFGLLAALAAALIVWRSPFAALLVAFVPFMTVSTVYRLDDDRLLRGALMLALALLFIGTLRGRRVRLEAPRRGMLAGSAVVALALLAAATPGVAKGAYFDWRNWRGAEKRGASVSYVWDHTYGKLVRPAEPVTVLEVTSPVRAYWRATVLEEFNAIGWVEVPSADPPTRGASLDVPTTQVSPYARERGRERFEVDFKNVGLDEPYLLTAGQPLAVDGISPRVRSARLSPANVIRTERSTPVKSTWQVDAVRMEPTVEDLQKATGAYDDPSLVPLNTAMQVRQASVQFPTFVPASDVAGSRQREATVAAIFDQDFKGDPRLESWDDAYALVRQVTGKANTPYEAAIRLESFFQNKFRYDENADFSRAVRGPLPEFLLGPERVGHCQMFAGSMAISLRMLGIPARVAEGFTPGGQDADDRYVVSDRDAHAWVEVLFPRLGWVPFEPTPTRSLPSVASSTSPQFLDSATQALGGVGRVDEFLGSAGGTAEQRRREEAQARAGATGEALDPASIADAAPWRPGFFTYALLGLAGLVSLVPLAKRARTLRAYVSRDPHRIAAAVRSDLVGYVQDQQPRNGHAALTPNELARLLDRDFSVDARGWVRQQTRARYGPDGPAAAEAARAARSEARGVKRELRRTLTAGERLSGALRLRSLIP